MLQLVAAFVIGCLAGGVASGLFFRRRAGSAPAAAAPVAAAELEPGRGSESALEPEAPPKPRVADVSELASASRQLLSELETRYQGRIAGESDNRGVRRRRPRSARPKRTQ
jgi:hypothetical protein